MIRTTSLLGKWKHALWTGSILQKRISNSSRSIYICRSLLWLPEKLTFDRKSSFPQLIARTKKGKADKNKNKDITKELSSEELLFDPKELTFTMEKTVAAFQSQLTTIRTGTAHPALLDRVMVEIQGTTCALKKVAQVSQKDSKTLRVQVFDPQMTNSVDKAIRSAGLGLNPQIERPGILSVPVPRPDKDTRLKLSKDVAKLAENARKAIRNTRNKVAQDIKKTNASEDEQKVSERALDQIMHQHLKPIDTLQLSKKEELGVE
eukprot:jgi/Galph1/4455/GphlegSOOS_G3087.1